MNRVRELYHSMPPSEKRGLKAYLEAFHQKGESKAIEFLKLLDQDPDITQESSSQKLYHDPRSKAFIMMKGRLLERMIEFLTLSVNPESSKHHRDSPYHQNVIEFRRCMLFASALQERQLPAMALEHLEKARELAVRCNSPELELDALIRLRALDRSGNDRFEELSIQIQRALQQQECDINAMGLLRKFLTLNGSEIGGNDERIAFLEAHLPGLEESIRQMYSPRADYFRQMLRVHLCYLTRRFEDGRGHARKVMQILVDHEGIRSPMRMAEGWVQLGRLELQDQDYAAAMDALARAASYQREASPARLTTSLLMLYCHIHLKDHSTAKGLVEQLKNGPSAKVMQQMPQNQGIFTYLCACIQFELGDYKEAWRLIQECQDAGLNKDSWMTSIRIFEIMILVERREHDLASNKL
ncbi:MAG: hypothetical protein RLZZ165_647, partial [Bacteroidota bacterium]